jgi:hypothetical protein
VSRLAFVPNAYTGRSTAFESQRFINLYPELSTAPNEKGVGLLVGVPGKRLFSSGLTAPVRGSITAAGVLYAVESNKLVAVAADGTVSVVGSLNTSTGRVSMSQNGLLSAGIGGDQLMIVDGVNGYIYNVVTAVFTVIEDVMAIQATASLTSTTTTVQSVTVTNPGSGYLLAFPPTAVITDGTGIGATLHVNLGYAIAGLGVTTIGSGIASTPTIIVTDPTGSGAIFTAVIVGGVMVGATKVSGGSGYTNPVITITNAPGYTLTPIYDYTSGSVVSVNVIDVGSGYTAPVVVFSSGSATATANVSATTVTAVNVTAGGSGYTSPPIVTVTGTGGTTEAVAVVTNFSVTAINIISGGTGYTGTTPTVTLSPPQGVSAPLAPQHVEYIEGYFIVTDGTMNAFASDMYNGLSWNAQATTPIQAASDNVSGLLNLHEQLFFIKQFTTEIFYNNGTPTSLGFPFSRMQGAVVDYGTPAPWSIARGNNSAFFLANERDGDSSCFVGVVELNGYTPTPITPPAIVYKMAQSTDHSQCFGYCYSDEGHTFYVITNPVDDWTFVYDTTTQMWHERSTCNLSDDLVHRDAANCYINAYGKHLVGDTFSGNIYEVSSKFNTDTGLPIISEQITQHLVDGQTLDDLFIDELQIDIESGVGLDDVSSPATALASLTTGAVSAVTVTYNGADYTLPPAVILRSTDGNGSGATATATVGYGSVISVNITAGGTGYTASPQVIFATAEVAPTAGLSLSKDGGRTWGAESIRSMGRIGEYRKRLRWLSLGRTKNRVFRLRISSPVKRIIMGWYAEGSR